MTTPQTEYEQYAQHQKEEREDQPRHIADVMHSIIDNWPAERREAFYRTITDNMRGE